MIFFLLIVFPFLIPLIYFINLRLLFSLSDQWYWLLIIVLVLDLAYFVFLYFRNKSKLRWLGVFFLHSLFYISLGFAFTLILTDAFATNLFSVLWPLMLIIFLYSSLHFAYETSRLLIIDIKNIIPYINVACFFVLTAVLINVNIFLAFPSWAVMIIFIVSAFVLNLPLFFLYEDKLKISFYYAGIVTLIISEIMLGMLFLPAGFYVLGATVAISYYLMMILLKKKFEGQLQRKDFYKHFSFAAVLLIIILATSQWI
ncbi:MAG: hypothetical protein WCV92_03330 [Candidatus Buchananbacteria bacterium]